MFGIRFAKAEPNTYVLLFKKGRVVREGTGLSFFYFAPVTSLVAVPLSSVDVPFIFEEVTSDFQEVTVQGQVVYRVQDPRRLAGLLDYSLRPDGQGYLSDDPQKLPQRVVDQVQVLVRAEMQGLPMRDSLKSSDDIVHRVRKGLATGEFAEQLGIEIVSLSILAVKANPETARALEAEMREEFLREADEAIYARRNASVEQERAIKENELNTEIAVENKKREIREAKIDADRAVQEKRQAMAEEEMKGKIVLEEQKRGWVDRAVQNRREEADAEAYATNAVMEAFRNVDPKVTQALASAGMKPAQLIAAAFQNLADNADKIGNLNITPELLQDLLQGAPRKRKAS
ncbi:MAG: SPFH domain-containing protein [Planctomycetota bacterium]|jgi:regulator of protease activity HflC (stomatin/prohibitin superfamily)